MKLKNIQNISQNLMSQRKAHTASSNFKSLGEHACVILNSRGAPLSVGYNTFKIKTPTTEHAEAMAFRKLVQSMRSKGIRKGLSVNVLVVRTNGGNSKPCSNCVDRMAKYRNIFIINKVLYTVDPTQPIQQESLSSLISDPNKHMSSFYRFRSGLRLSLQDNSDEDDTDDNILGNIFNIIVKRKFHGYTYSKVKKVYNKPRRI